MAQACPKAHPRDAARQVVVVQPEVCEIGQEASPGRQVASQLIGVQQNVAQQLQVSEIWYGALHCQHHCSAPVKAPNAADYSLPQRAKLNHGKLHSPHIPHRLT